MNIWGVHNNTLTTELVDEGFISLGWDNLGDLRSIGGGREGLKSALTEAEPDAKPRSIAGQAGVLTRFRDEMRVGDVIVAPYKPDSTINLGLVVSEYYFEPTAETHKHRRQVEWKRVGLPRTVFSQAALYEIGSVLAVFRVRRHGDEFLAALDGRRSLWTSSPERSTSQRTNRRAMTKQMSREHPESNDTPVTSYSRLCIGN